MQSKTPAGKDHERSAESRAAEAGQSLPPDEVKVLPPDSPVTVPNQPAPAARGQDEAGAQGRARADNKTESNWADGSAPQPRAKNARSSLF